MYVKKQWWNCGWRWDNNKNNSYSFHLVYFFTNSKITRLRFNNSNKLLKKINTLFLKTDCLHFQHKNSTRLIQLNFLVFTPNILFALYISWKTIKSQHRKFQIKWNRHLKNYFTQLEGNSITFYLPRIKQLSSSYKIRCFGLANSSETAILSQIRFNIWSGSVSCAII